MEFALSKPYTRKELTRTKQTKEAYHAIKQAHSTQLPIIQ